MDEVPKSMIIKRTTLSKDLKELKKEFRDVLYPFTAMKYKESTKYTFKEILNGAKAFGVTNLLLMSTKEKGDYLKMTQIPSGPTFTFRLKEMSLIQDLIKAGVTTSVENST